MRGLAGFVGIGCFLAGIYGLGRKIVLTAGNGSLYYSSYWGSWSGWWYGIAAAGTVLLAVAGLVAIVFLRGQARWIGGGLLALSGVLVVFSGRAVLLPTTLFEFLVSVFLMAIGVKLFLNSALANRGAIY
ncbi:MAG: hypothetical protein SNJ67_07045 [Chloracidobacterium sp.]|uniref:Uncharacterized protein n=1 Tax=Chloracidobacterium validum TaxID=2821543 RepID=A0ABX8BDD5_9BACT|nr:hypothetical protein [Chloracidobacterium validum]QUW04696.1 hypothetical protein J8C06_13070 [Chloracidobacterium validum]